MNIEITEEEAAVVKSLIEFYHAAYDHAPHRRTCECSFCTAYERVGEHLAKHHDSLGEKCGYDDEGGLV